MISNETRGDFFYILPFCYTQRELFWKNTLNLWFTLNIAVHIKGERNKEVKSVPKGKKMTTKYQEIKLK